MTEMGKLEEMFKHHAALMENLEEFEKYCIECVANGEMVPNWIRGWFRSLRMTSSERVSQIKEGRS